MADTEQTAEGRKRPGVITALGGPQFLAAQFFTIFATMLGVYLAGYVGFQRTLDYDHYTKAQQQSDLVTALQEEMKQNIVRLRKLEERLPADSGSGVAPAEWPRLRQFMWQSAGRSTSFFDVPPHALADVQAFYEDIGEMLNDNEARQAFARLSSSNTYERTKFKERLGERLKYAETSILPAFAKVIAESRQTVAQYSR